MAHQAITIQFVMLQPPQQAIRTWQVERTQWMANGKFMPTAQGPDTLTYTSKYIPAWAIVVSILLFPIGLLAALLVRDVDVLSLSFDAYGSDTLVTLTGAAGSRTRR